MRDPKIVLSRLTFFFQENPKQLLQRLYVQEQRSAKEIGKLLHINGERTVPALLDYLHITRRSRPEALKLKWSQDPERHKRMSELMQRETSARRPEVREKMNATRIAQHRKNPSSHPNAKVAMSKYETVFADVLKSAGIRYAFNASFPPYWVDFHLPDYNIGIECYRDRGDGMDYKRHSIIEMQGITLYYLPTSYLRTTYHGGRVKGVFAIQKGRQAIASLIQGIQTGKFDPAMPREHFLSNH